MLKVTRARCEQKLVRVRPTLCQAIHYFWAAQQQRILSHEIEQKRREQNARPGQNGERYQSHIERHLFRFRHLLLSQDLDHTLIYGEVVKLVHACSLSK